MKKHRSSTSALAIKKIAKDTGLSEITVRQYVRDTSRDSEAAETCRKKYKKVIAELDSVKP